MSFIATSLWHILSCKHRKAASCYQPRVKVGLLFCIDAFQDNQKQCKFDYHVSERGSFRTAGVVLTKIKSDSGPVPGPARWAFQEPIMQSSVSTDKSKCGSSSKIHLSSSGPARSPIIHPRFRCSRNVWRWTRTIPICFAKLL